MQIMASRGKGVWILSLALAWLLSAVVAPAQTPVPSTRTTPEQRTARALETARANPLDLHAFLVDMPKGTDLHNHLGGAVYAESWIRVAAEDGLCVDKTTDTLLPAPGATNNGNAAPQCGNGKVPASDAFKDQHLYDALVDAFSMRGFVPTPGVTGHDHFFDTFDRLEQMTQTSAMTASGSTKWPRALRRRTSSTWN